MFLIQKRSKTTKNHKELKTMNIEDLQKINIPPINEVVCGFTFEAIQGLDPLMIGAYWDSVQERFPKRQLHPPLGENIQLNPRNIPLRAWLVSDDELELIQIQRDRFYCNWRAQIDGQYPGFNGGTPGVLWVALREYESFLNFCEERFASRQIPNQIELSKINLIEQGLHWESRDDLIKIIPSLDRFTQNNQHDFNLRWSIPSDDGRIILGLQSVLIKDSGLKAVQFDLRGFWETKHLEIKHQTFRADDLLETFERANQNLNRVFIELLGEEALQAFITPSLNKE